VAKNLVIAFEICRDPEGTPDQDKKCRDEAFIKKWMNRKFIILHENEVEFVKETIEQPKLKKSSRLVW